MNEYITKLEEENKKLQETNSLYQARYGDIYETIEKEKPKIIDLDSTTQEISGSLGGSFDTVNANGDLFTLKGSNIAQYGGVSVSNGFGVSGYDMNVWQPHEEAKKLQKEINDLKNIIINQRKPFYKRKFRLIMRKIKRTFK